MAEAYAEYNEEGTEEAYAEEEQVETPAPRGRGRGRGAGGPRGRGGPPRGRGYARGPAQTQIRKRQFQEDYEYDYHGGFDSKKKKIQDDVYRFLIREDLVRPLIGKGGQNMALIKEAVKEAGHEVGITIYSTGDNGLDLMPGALDRVMSIRGTIEGMENALHQLIGYIQTHQNHKENPNYVPKPGGKPQKLEIRLVVPKETCSAIIGKEGSVVTPIKEETASYIQVYTLPLPKSDEYCVRVQNFDKEPLALTARRIFEQIADIKGKTPVKMYEPIYFTHGHYGDTGSYIDSDWYQDALKKGIAKPTPYAEIRNAMAGHHPAPSPRARARGRGRGRGLHHVAHDPYSDPYADPYAGAYDASYEMVDPYAAEYYYGEEEEAAYAGYEDPYAAYTYAPPAPRARGRGRGHGPPLAPARGAMGRGRARARGAPRGRGGAAPVKQETGEE